MAGITKFTNVDVSNDFYIGGVEVTATAAALNILDTVTATAADLNNAATLVAAPVLAAEHGPGAIGTAATPKTRRWTENGVIVTQTTFDVTGLASINDADDVIGLAAGAPAAFIGQNVVATNGVIFRAELSCLETPVTGATDIDVKFAATAAGALDTDGAAYGSLIDGASLVAGQTVVNNTPAVTANHYYYLTAGTGAAGTYTAGMFMLTTYGHAVLA